MNKSKEITSVNFEFPKGSPSGELVVEIVKVLNDLSTEIEQEKKKGETLLYLCSSTRDKLRELSIKGAEGNMVNMVVKLIEKEYEKEQLLKDIPESEYIN